MTSIVVKGVITPEGKLQVELPTDIAPGPVEVEIRTTDIEGVSLGELLKSELVGLWADRSDIQDSVEFARSLRQSSHKC